jgi:hypothetical protein
MKLVMDPAELLLRRLMRLLRWRLWVQEKLQPTEWQVTLLWAALAGFLGALASVFFLGLAEGVHELFGYSGEGVGVVDGETEGETLGLAPIERESVEEGDGEAVMQQ